MESTYGQGPPKYWRIPHEKRLWICQQLGLESNPLQDQIVLCPSRFVLFRGARRIGKSYASAKRHFPMSLCPQSLHWIVGPTYDLAHKEFRYWLDFLLKFQARMGKKCLGRVYDQPAAGQLYIKTSWGAEIHGKSASNPQSLVGEGLDSVVLAEAAQLNRDIWERFIRPTLATKQGYATFSSTPDAAGLWLYELELLAATLDNWTVFTMPAWECPHYAPEEIAEAKAALSEDAFYEQYGGEWRFYTGRVYKLFKPDVHLVDPFDVPQSWEVGSGIDFGYRDPFAAELCARSPTGEVYLFAEYYQSNTDKDAKYSTQEHASQILRLEERYGIQRQRMTRVADHHGLGVQMILEAGRAGMPCIPCASHDRRARRDCAMSALTPKPNRHPYHIREAGLPPGDYPDVFFMKGRCPNLVREMQFLRWKDNSVKEGAVTDTEGDNHAIDALEYRLERWGTGRVVRFRRAGNANTGPAVLDQTGYLSKWRGNVPKHPWQQGRRLA